MCHVQIYMFKILNVHVTHTVNILRHNMPTYHAPPAYHNHLHTLTHRPYDTLRTAFAILTFHYVGHDEHGLQIF